MLEQTLNKLMSKASSLNVRAFVNAEPNASSSEDLRGFLKSQSLAERGALEVSGLLVAGMTERKASDLLETWLRDHGVNAFFHLPYVWFGERTRFTHIDRRLYQQYMPSGRVLQENEPYILDVAPIVDGYVSDIGFSNFFGESSLSYKKMIKFLAELRNEIPSIVKTSDSGEQVWKAVDQLILKAGFENIHRQYPFNVLGHRVHKTSSADYGLKLLNFGALSFTTLLSRGLFSQLMSRKFSGPLDGLWAIEPHIGYGEIGAKFEEILCIAGKEVYWLDQNEKFGSRL